MLHYVRNGFRNTSDAGQVLSHLYGWHMSDDQLLVYNDVEKTLVMYLGDNIEWRADNYDIDADMHSYLQSL